MKSLKNLFLIVAALFSTAMVLSSCSDDDHDNNQEYDVIKINGESYACYGHRSLVGTYETVWNLSSHKGTLTLPCDKLSDAQKGEYEIEYMFDIWLKGDQDLKKRKQIRELLTYICSYRNRCRRVGIQLCKWIRYHNGQKR